MHASGLLLAIGVVAFASLGLPDGVLGVAWPSVRRGFDLMHADLGVLLASAMIGYLLSAFSSGPVVSRLGVGRVLAWSSATMVAASFGYALTPTWPVMVTLGILTGLGAGAIDAGINAFAAARFRPGHVTWLHAAYGVGAMLGPVLMTSVLAAGLGWRWGYAVIGGILTVLTVAFALTVRLWDAAPSERVRVGDGGDAGHGAGRDGDSGASGAGLVAALRQPPVWRNVAIFFVYTGLEATAGQWSYTLLTESRAVGMGSAGTAVAVYWGSLTLGRLVFGVLARRQAPERLLLAAVGGAPLAACLVWWAPGAGTSALGLAALGFVLAPVYPLLISLTPARVGAAHAASAVGFQVAAAYLGAAALPALAGVLSHRVGLEMIPLVMVGAAVATLGLEMDARRRQPMRRTLDLKATPM